MKITNEIIQTHGLNNDEFLKIKQLLNRDPNLLELGIFSAMWNETVRINLQNSFKKITS